MIVRGARNLREVLFRIDQSEFLGPIEESLLRQSLARHGGQIPLVQHNLNDSRDNLVAGAVPRGSHSFGFFLPHGLSHANADFLYTNALSTVRRSFNAVEEAFRVQFNLTKASIMLESEQAEFYEDHPERLPGVLDNGPDGTSFANSSMSQ